MISPHSSWPGLTRPPRISRGGAQTRRGKPAHDADCLVDIVDLDGEKELRVSAPPRAFPLLGGRLKGGHDEWDEVQP